MPIRWPRGRYNGRRIVGVQVRVKFSRRKWLWRPVVLWSMCGGLHWLCLRTWTNFEYED